MASELQGTAIEAFWTGTSFLLTSTVFQPFFASLSHIIGRKPIILIALSFFTVGSIVATAANSFAILILGRSIQGIGGGGLTVLTYVVVADMIPLRERGKWFSLISFQWVIGSIAGPVMGGVFVEKTTWRWIFILNFPFCLLAFIGIPILLKLNYKVGSILEKLKAIDWIGAFLFIASLTTFLVPLSWGKSSPMIYSSSRTQPNLTEYRWSHVLLVELEYSCPSHPWCCRPDNFCYLLLALLRQASHPRHNLHLQHRDRGIPWLNHVWNVDLVVPLLYATLLRGGQVLLAYCF